MINKVLSVRQPYADLICHGIKDVENRSRKINYRGRVWIHASATVERPVFTIEQVLDIDETRDETLSLNGVYILSAILGSVEIVDCIRDSESIWAIPGMWHWILKDAVLFDEPILNVKGKLGLWNYEGGEK